MENLKICVVGEEGTGKTSFVEIFATSKFEFDIKSTLRANVFDKVISRNNIKVKIQIWEFGGKKQLSEIYRRFLLGAKGIIYTFDLHTFNNIEMFQESLFTWTEFLRFHDKDLSILLVGTKKDLVSKPPFKNDKLKEILGKYNLFDYIEISSKTGENVDKAFSLLLREIFKKEKIVFTPLKKIEKKIIKEPFERKREIQDILSGRTEIYDLRNKINWELMEKNDILTELEIDKLILKDRDYDQAIVDVLHKIERIILNLYRKFIDDNPQVTSYAQLKRLLDSKIISDQIFNNINAIRGIRNLIIHKEKLKADEDSYKYILRKLAQILYYIYENFVLKEVVPLEEDLKKIIKYNVDLNTIEKINKFKPLRLMLNEFRVVKLFGKYDYSIKINSQETFTLIFGPNGSGKTTILEMISHFSKGDIYQILNLNFKELHLTFSHTISQDIKFQIQINKNENDVQIRAKIPGLINDKVVFYHSKDDFFRYIFNMHRVYNTAEIWSITTKMEAVRRYFPKRYENYFNNLAILEAFYMIIRNFECYYIPALRIEISIDDMYKYVDKLRAGVDELCHNTLEEIKKEMFDNYILYKVMEFEKLNVYKVNKVALFFEILNEFFYDKTIALNNKNQLEVLDKNKNQIPLISLSSGEKNIFMIFYDCIFKISKQTIVLIDEPEISLHAEWQIAFLKKLNNIKSSDIQDLQYYSFLIATHSPQIINNKWDCTLDLEDGDSK